MVFVFGSNLAGRHGAGAALYAAQHHGAQRGVGEGPTGDAYALPTKDERLRVLPLNIIELKALAFCEYALQHSTQQFQLTAIGCGLAGYSPAQIAPFFVRVSDNVELPDEFANVLGRGRHVAPIRAFVGEYQWLSNFHSSRVVHREWVYPTVEHGFQATKTVDPAEREWVRSARSPGEAKQRGRAVTMRANWDAIRDRVMLHFVREKFAIPHLRDRLRLTGRAELVEGNTWGDRYWGVCRGHGENRLGHILMQVREEVS